MFKKRLSKLKINLLTKEKFDSIIHKENELYFVEDKNPLSIPEGGTNANNIQDAKKNLGIIYGIGEPSGIPNTGEGTIYFKIKG